MNITALQHQQRSLLSLSFPLLCEQTCNSRRWRYAAGKAETTCLICKSCHLTSGVAISYSAARQRPWKNRPAGCKRQRGYSFVLKPEKEDALTGHANTEWKYKYNEMRGVTTTTSEKRELRDICHLCCSFNMSWWSPHSFMRTTSIKYFEEVKCEQPKYRTSNQPKTIQCTHSINQLYYEAFSFLHYSFTDPQMRCISNEEQFGTVSRNHLIHTDF